MEGNIKLNTLPFRHAITRYIENILGLVHEDYNYSKVNKLIEIKYKKFIKKISCYPNKLNKEDFIMLNLAFNKEEIMHIILLVTVMKSRAQLTFLARGIYEVIKNIEWKIITFLDYDNGFLLL